MNPTQVVVRDGKDLVNLVVACAPFDWNEDQMRYGLDAILVRAISRGQVWGTDWLNCWPQSDGEWSGVLAEAHEMYGNDPLRAPAAAADVGGEPVGGEFEDARKAMLQTELDYTFTPDVADELEQLISNVSSSDQVLPHQSKWQLTMAVALAFRAGYRNALEPDRK